MSWKRYSGIFDFSKGNSGCEFYTLFFLPTSTLLRSFFSISDLMSLRE